MQIRISGNYSLGEACRFAEELDLRGIKVNAILPTESSSIRLERWTVVYISKDEQFPTFPIMT